MTEFLMGYLQARVRVLEESIDEWDAHSKGLKNRISELEDYSENLRRSHNELVDNYKKLRQIAGQIEAERDELNKIRKTTYHENEERDQHKRVVLRGASAQINYLLKLLDEALGEDNNPARQSSSDNMTYLAGESEGAHLTGLHNAYIQGLRNALEELPEAAAFERVRDLGRYDLISQDPGPPIKGKNELKE